MIDLVHDVLDKLVLDRDKHNMGRVDSLVLELRDDGPPRVVYLEMGGVALAKRLGGFGQWLAMRIASIGHAPHSRERQPFRVAWDHVREIGPANIVVSLDAEASRAFAWERWLRDHVVRRVPGGS